MALSGEMTAIGDDSDEACIQILTLALRPGAEATPIGRPEERIGSIRVRPDGTVAWIACPLGPDADPDKIIISPSPSASRRGAPATAFCCSGRRRGFATSAYGS